MPELESQVQRKFSLEKEMGWTIVNFWSDPRVGKRCIRVEISGPLYPNEDKMMVKDLPTKKTSGIFKIFLYLSSTIKHRNWGTSTSLEVDMRYRKIWT